MTTTLTDRQCSYKNVHVPSLSKSDVHQLTNQAQASTKQKLSSSAEGFQAHRDEFRFVQAAQHSSGDFLLSKPSGHLAALTGQKKKVSNRENYGKDW